MLGRHLSVSLEKNTKTEKSEGSPTEPHISPAIEITAGLDRIAQTIIKGVLLYIAADTARKVIVKSTKEG